MKNSEVRAVRANFVFSELLLLELWAPLLSIVAFEVALEAGAAGIAAILKLLIIIVRTGRPVFYGLPI